MMWKMPFRSLWLSLLMCGLVGCVPTQSGALQVKDMSVYSQTNSLWDLIESIERHMPLSVAKAEAALGGRFALTKEGPAYTVLDAPGGSLKDGVTVTTARMMLKPSLQFEDKSALVLELQGTCITLEHVRARYPDLILYQAPRGRSLDEVSAWSVARTWGSMTFAFQERQPDCLFRVGFHKQLN